MLYACSWRRPRCQLRGTLSCRPLLGLLKRGASDRGERCRSLCDKRARKSDRQQDRVQGVIIASSCAGPVLLIEKIQPLPPVPSIRPSGPNIMDAEASSRVVLDKFHLSYMLPRLGSLLKDEVGLIGISISCPNVYQRAHIIAAYSTSRVGQHVQLDRRRASCSLLPRASKLPPEQHHKYGGLEMPACYSVSRRHSAIEEAYIDIDEVLGDVYMISGLYVDHLRYRDTCNGSGSLKKHQMWPVTDIVQFWPNTAYV